MEAGTNMVMLMTIVFLVGLKLTEAFEDPRFIEPDVLPPAPNNLRFAFLMVRHGVRSPVFDPPPSEELQSIFATNWPEGKGALTAAGEEQMRHVGRSLKTRYESFVPIYNSETVLITSTNKARTAMSIRDLATGMFFPADASRESIPVKQDTPYDKHWLFDNYKPCPAYEKIMESIHEEEKTRESVSRRVFYKKLNKELQQKYRLNNYLNTLDDVFVIWDTWNMEDLNLKPMPTWVKSYMQPLDELAHLRMWRVIHGKTGMIQFYSGTTFNEVLKEFDEQSSAQGQLKLHLHGSHDISLCSIFWCLAPRHETFFAKPGDAVILEMYNDDTLKLFLYSPLEKKKNARFQPISLKPLCKADPCPLEDFKKSLQCQLDEEQWNKKCNEFEMKTEYRPEPRRSNNPLTVVFNNLYEVICRVLVHFDKS